MFSGTVVKNREAYHGATGNFRQRGLSEDLLHPVSHLWTYQGLTNKHMVKTMHQVLESRELTQEYLPEEYRTHYGLSEYNYAVAHIHFPKNRKNWQ